MNHELAICAVATSLSSKFICPNCLRFTWQHLSFLGQRKVLCDGEKFSKTFARQAASSVIIDFEMVKR